MTQNTQSFSSWLNTIKADDIDGGLAADFDGSLSGLGVELGSSTYNMSEALLALPVFKSEHFEQGLVDLLEEGRRVLGDDLGLAEELQALASCSAEVPQGAPEAVPEPAASSVVQITPAAWTQDRFQYVLNAATSPATKVNEETLTYLNQGQPYEVKLKRLGEGAEIHGKFAKSTIRVIFHERRLQYMEREQIVAWEQARPGEKILDLDIPLSYGVLDVKQVSTNAVQFLWDPNKNAGIHIKVNCISTEFTAKKHGGEKGVPFRVQVETYILDGTSSYKLLHCASCQVKVFKPKGADRKHKTDREKLEKRQPSERDVYQPSYECTVLTEIPLDQAQNYLEQLSKYQNEEIERKPSSGGTGGLAGAHGSASNLSALGSGAAATPHKPPQQQQSQSSHRDPAGVRVTLVNQPSKADPSVSPPALVSNISNLNLSATSNTATPPSTSPLKSSPITSGAASAGPGRGKDVRNFGCLSDDSKSSTDSSFTFHSTSGLLVSTPSKSQSGSKGKGVKSSKVPKVPVSPLPSAEKAIEPLLAEATAQEVTQWLHHNRFSHYVKVFQNFAGADLLRLSRDDLIQICGLADGIRLNNALQAKTLRPKLTLYLCQLRTRPQLHSTPSPSTSPTSVLHSLSHAATHSHHHPHPPQLSPHTHHSASTHTATSLATSPITSVSGGGVGGGAGIRGGGGGGGVGMKTTGQPQQHPLISPAHLFASPAQTILTPGPVKTKRQYGESLEQDEDEGVYTKKQRTPHLNLAKKGVYHALYLEHLTREDLRDKIAALFSVLSAQLRDLYVQGPSGIQVLVTDEVVANFTNESRYSIEAFQDEDSDIIEYIVHLRSSV